MGKKKEDLVFVWEQAYVSGLEVSWRASTQIAIGGESKERFLVRRGKKLGQSLISGKTRNNLAPGVKSASGTDFPLPRFQFYHPNGKHSEKKFVTHKHNVEAVYFEKLGKNQPLYPPKKTLIFWESADVLGTLN